MNTIWFKGILLEKTQHSSSKRAQYLMIEAVFSSFFENTVHELRSIRSLILTTPVLSVGAPIPFIVLGDQPPHTGRTALIVGGHSPSSRAATKIPHKGDTESLFFCGGGVTKDCGGSNFAPEVGVSRWPPQTDGQTDIATL